MEVGGSVSYNLFHQTGDCNLGGWFLVWYLQRIVSVLFGVVFMSSSQTGTQCSNVHHRIA